MKIDWTLNAWQVITAVVFMFGAYGSALKLYHLLDKRITTLEQKFEVNSKDIGDHSSRLGRFENALFKIVADLQRVVGRVEVVTDEPHRHRRVTD